MLVDSLIIQRSLNRANIDKLRATPELVCSQLNLPADFTEKILNLLVKAGLLLKTSEPATGFAPATIAENLNLAEIYDAVKNASFVAPGDEAAVIKRINKNYRQTLAAYTVRNLMEV
jgi:DNA-binding IscR family transcriptional regulator